MAIVFDWKASRLDALFDVYYLDASTLDLKYARCFMCSSKHLQAKAILVNVPMVPICYHHD